jgi:hypothetical protein
MIPIAISHIADLRSFFFAIFPIRIQLRRWPVRSALVGDGNEECSSRI